ncbi:hypothetical protein POM88_031875 [Heracleum sosnowskyi]|uniref:Uncharacterized protein n=1 Tax=Heracleum sosnowskyi TaxID=360622 RepID=A0AAD8HY91_9APIA|nr:hypothetical protein POM88_031875 [Heracleum sosnowskyi]
MASSSPPAPENAIATFSDSIAADSVTRTMASDSIPSTKRAFGLTVDSSILCARRPSPGCQTSLIAGATDAANKEKSNQQPSAPNSNASRKKSAQGHKEEKLPHVKSTGQRATPSNHPFDNTYSLPNNTADNQTERNLFSFNK